MYRQAVALSIQRGRPGLASARPAPPEAAEVELASFRPHLLVHNDSTGGLVSIPEAALEAVPYRLEVLYSQRIAEVLTLFEGSYQLSAVSFQLSAY